MVTVLIHKSAKKALKKAPVHIQEKLDSWVASLVLNGLETVQLVPGWHDESLTGKRQNQRSIRLNLHWRAIYEETETGITITVLEVTHHDYRSK